MKLLIRLEEAAIFLLTLYLFSQLGYEWWVFPVLLFLPDISMIGYLAGNKTGAIIYNLVHHRGTGIIIYLTGVVLTLNPVALAGVIFLAHSTADRVFGYGLKHFEGFKHTHLGTMK